MGPAVEEDAQRAGGADTSLPGREALQTPFQEGTAARRPGLRSGAPQFPNLFLRVVRG